MEKSLSEGPTRPRDDELFDRLYASGKLPAILKGAGIFLKDYASRTCVPNTLWTDLGYTARDLRKELWRELLHPEDAKRTLAGWDAVYSGKSDVWSGDFRIRARDGSWRHVRHRTFVLERNAEGVPSLTVGLDLDLSDLYEKLSAERAARELAEARLLDAELLRSAGAIASSALDRLEAIDRVFAQARSMFDFDIALAWHAEDGGLLCIRGMGTAAALDEEDASLALRSMAERRVLVDDNPEKRPTGGFVARSRLCVPLILRNTVLAVLEFLAVEPCAFGEQSIRRALGFSDSAAIALANSLRFAVSEKSAGTDWLTGLGNRRRLEDRGRSMLGERHARVSCIMIDIDRFKQVNDSFGHQAGDAVLKELGALCRGLLRDVDLVCRYGGEEIVAVLPGADLEAAREAAERIRLSVQPMRIPGYPELSITISAGCASVEPPACSDGSTELRRLIALADTALYRAKSKGRNRVVAET